MLSGLSKYSPYGLALLRIFTALTFISHGTQKLFGFPTAFPYPLNGLLYTAATLEIVGGILIVIGLFTRPVAFILSGLMAAAFFMGHFAPTYDGFFPILNGGEAAMLFSFIFFYLFLAGPGTWSVDASRGQA